MAWVVGILNVCLLQNQDEGILELWSARETLEKRAAGFIPTG